MKASFGNILIVKKTSTGLPFRIHAYMLFIPCIIISSSCRYFHYSMLQIIAHPPSPIGKVARPSHLSSPSYHYMMSNCNLGFFRTIYVFQVVPFIWCYSFRKYNDTELQLTPFGTPDKFNKGNFYSLI